MDFFVYDLRQTVRLEHPEGKPFRHTIPPGEEPAKGFEDIGKLRKVDLTIKGNIKDVVTVVGKTCLPGQDCGRATF